MNTTETRRPTDADVADAIARGKREILDDIGVAISSRGDVMPATVASFAELHDYVDANEYGGLCDEGEIEWLPDWDEVQDGSAVDRGADVQNALDAWLRAGRPDA